MVSLRPYSTTVRGTVEQQSLAEKTRPKITPIVPQNHHFVYGLDHKTATFFRFSTTLFDRDFILC
jgi:hypothetical protein